MFPSLPISSPPAKPPAVATPPPTEAALTCTPRSGLPTPPASIGSRASSDQDVGVAAGIRQNPWDLYQQPPLQRPRCHRSALINALQRGWLRSGLLPGKQIQLPDEPLRQAHQVDVLCALSWREVQVWPFFAEEDHNSSCAAADRIWCTKMPHQGDRSLTAALTAQFLPKMQLFWQVNDKRIFLQGDLPQAVSAWRTHGRYWVLQAQALPPKLLFWPPPPVDKTAG